MALVAAAHDPSSRRRVIPVYLQHGAAGLLLLVAVTLVRAGDTSAILDALGPSAPLLIVLFFLFVFSLALLKFPLTEQIFVSLVITADMAMVPLLGVVLSAWLAAGAAVAQRVLAMLHIGPSKIDMRDAKLEWARTFSLFGTYGIPVIVATMCYEALGGRIPELTPSVAAAARMAAGSAILVAMNNLIVARVEHALGYSMATSFKLAVIDSSIYLITIPYAILTTFAYGSIGWGGVLAAAFTGVVANYVARKLAVTRGDRDQLIQRLTSLTNIGKTISLDCTQDELLTRIYIECTSVIDASLFSIALVEPSTNTLSFELNVEDGVTQKKEVLPIGEGLNSWVVIHRKPLLIGSSRDERKLGVHSYDDGVPTESWLGVPMVAHDRVVGVISIQSYRKNAFTQSDVVLLTAIANQAAVAIENTHLYKDLEGLNLALEQRVSERTNELRETNLRLVAADRSKNQFLANMSHELRTPLNAIIGFSTILLGATQTLLPARLFKFLENIRTAGSHLLDLINDILDLAKIESGKLAIEPESFDLRETVGTVERVIKGMAAEHDVTVVTRIEDGLSLVYLDEGRFKQILLNLLSNAVKFSPRGGFVYLNVTHLAAERSPLGCDTIRIDVEDRGIGIPPDELQHIFDEFYQATQSPSARKTGTGLGLSLARNFVELHRGTIGVVSEPGKGATFTIHLPRTYSAALPPQPRRSLPPIVAH
jgi:signal transduction histidine kinase